MAPDNQRMDSASSGASLRNDVKSRQVGCNEHMGAYSFKKRFIPMVEDGSKTHTIRGKRKNRDRPGSTFHAFYAMRTRQCRKLFAAPVLKVEDISIMVYLSYSVVHIEGEQLSKDELQSFARRDGFENADDMHRFWVAEHGMGPFSGDVIHWDYERRVSSTRPAVHQAGSSTQLTRAPAAE